jgi:hypothetical protein
LEWEIDYRRQRQWDIFSWCSTLLIAIIGGTIALRTGFFASQPMTWTLYLELVISGAVLVLVANSLLWLSHHRDREMKARDHLTEDWLKFKPHWGFTFSSNFVVVLLGVAAILAIWIPLTPS